MTDERVPMTREGYEKRKADLDRMKSVEMIELGKRVAAARDLGDLSENAEYHAAREDQGMLQAKVNQLQDELNRAIIIDPSALPKDTVVFGATVKVKDLDEGDEESFTLVGPGQETRAVARLLIPDVLKKAGLGPIDDNRQVQSHLIGLIAPRLLLPSRWFSGDAGRAGYDLFQIKERYTTVGFEMIALRFLDLDEPCIIAIVDDDGTVAARKSNRFQAPRKLTDAELRCRAIMEETGEPAQARGSGWRVWGWPTPGIPFRRMIFRSVPDDV